jgi:predicted transcriptional regulator
MPKRKVIELSENVSPIMKDIGIRVTQLRQKVGSNYKIFASSHNLNNMTLWRIEKGEDYKMSSFIQVLIEIGISPAEFFKDIQ